MSRYILINVLLFLQVLHLMNKMNIPAPFRMALPTPPLSSHVSAPQPPPPPPQPSITEDLRSADLSSDESELESSDVCSTSAFLVFTL
jgi:U11/U12 small nuclear ribonucleoprotein 65 kDa protein